MAESEGSQHQERPAFLWRRSLPVRFSPGSDRPSTAAHTMRRQRCHKNDVPNHVWPSLARCSLDGTEHTNVCTLRLKPAVDFLSGLHMPERLRAALQKSREESRRRLWVGFGKIRLRQLRDEVLTHVNRDRCDELVDCLLEDWFQLERQAGHLPKLLPHERKRDAPNSAVPVFAQPTFPCLCPSLSRAIAQQVFKPARPTCAIFHSRGRNEHRKPATLQRIMAAINRDDCEVETELRSVRLSVAGAGA